MYCTNHPKIEANATCVGCGNFFCSDCLVKIKGKNYCKDCVAEQLEKKETDAVSAPHPVQPQIIIQQQQQQQQTQPQSTSDKPRGSWCWLVFWIIIFFPIAIIYALTRRWD